MLHKKSRISATVLACTFAVAVGALKPASHAQSADRWVGTWATALVGRPQTPPMPGPPAPAPFMRNACPAPQPPANPPATPPAGATFAPQPFMHFTNQTLRQIVRTSVGGSRLRIVLSNTFGNAPLVVGAAHVALRDKEDAIATARGGPLTFSGRTSVTIPAHAVVYSDPVALSLSPLADLAIDVYLPGSTNTPATLSMHGSSFQTSYVSETGNHVGVPKLPTVATTRSWFILSRVEVGASDAAGVVVAFGDSITDGAASTVDANSRWPDVLARRLLASPAPVKVGVLNAGIGGNRVLSEGTYGAGINALARFEVDALSHSGVTHIIVMEGINDIGNARQNPTPTADDLIAAHKQLITRAHAKGVKIFGATLTPFWGAAYYTEIGEAKRQALNDWIRNGKAYDGVIDFDKATRDPADPKKLLAAYDSCDHLHPSDAGYKAMGESIDVNLFRSGR
jgi:lysophospholipase L1-like esterase